MPIGPQMVDADSILKISQQVVKQAASSGQVVIVGRGSQHLLPKRDDIFCDTPPPAFGQFFVTSNGGSCIPLVRQGVSGKVAAVEFGVVTTDVRGKGSFKVVVGPIASSTYKFEFTARDRAGCNLIGGAGNGSDSFADFQSPGPFGTVTTITVL